MAQTYGQQGQQTQSQEYTLPGVLHFLQSEWRRYERDRNEWEIERAEMKARIALLEGERRGIENMKTDLMRRVKMLEYASKYVAEKSHSNNTVSPPGIATTEVTSSTNVNGIPITGLKQTSRPVSAQYTNIQLTRDQKTRAKSQQLLKNCLQEIEYLTNVATTGISPIPNRSDTVNLNDSAQAFSQQANRSSTIYLGPDPHGTLSHNRNDSREQIRPSRPAPSAPSTIVPPKSSSPPLEQVSTSRKHVNEYEDNWFNATEDRKGKNKAETAKSNDEDEDDYNEEQSTPISSSPFSPSIDETSDTVSTIRGNKDGSNRVGKKEGGYLERGADNEEIVTMYAQKSFNRWREAFGNKISATKKPSRKSAEEEKMEEEQLKKDVQAKFNLSNEKLDKVIRTTRRMNSHDFIEQTSDPQLGELSNAWQDVDDEQGNQAETDQEHVNGVDNKLWKTRATLRSHLDSVRSLSWHRYEPLFVSGSDDGTVKLWDLNETLSPKQYDIKPILTYRGHTLPVTSVVLSTEQSTCYSASMDATIRVWKIPATRELYAPVDPSLNLTAYIGHTDVIWDLRLFPIHDQNSQLLASAAADGTVKIWDTEEVGSPLKSTWNYYGIGHADGLNGGGRPPVPTSIDFVHTDLKKIAVSFQNSIIKIFDIETGQPVVTFKSDKTYDGTASTQINRIICHPTMPQVFSAHEDKYIRGFDINSGDTIFSMSAHLDSVTSLDIDPSGMILISGGHDASIRLWDILSGQTCVQEFMSHRRKSDEGVLCLQYHPTLPWLASGGADSVVKIYN
ncbi:1082_t:CDS:10 [Paraglomus occultum]|uniref:1082_t:CDS:1 n=1 Tax=Paraglomus occultum TaxID=144539 RepID=A0A9N9ABI4_9GLOM|nr:1082_t:CDS:10 [Paraglomus occultum]